MVSQVDVPVYSSSMSAKRVNRVLVTGYGAVTPFGTGAPLLEWGLFNGVPAIRPISGFDASHLDVQIAGEVPDFQPTDHIGRHSARRMDRFAQFAVAAAREAIEHAGVNLDRTGRDRVAAVIHTGAGGVPALVEAAQIVRAGDLANTPPLMIARYAPNMASTQVSIELGLLGPSLTGTGACASGTLAIIEGMQLIQRGEVDVVVAGGAEACVTEIGIVGFDNLGVLSKRNHDPAGANRPFSVDREGTVLAEGACVLILESEAHAIRRGAAVYAEVLAGAVTSDAYHVTAPHPEGTYLAKALQMAVERAGLRSADIDLVSMHATASQAGDLAECRALHRAFGPVARSIPVTATKSMTGHMIGGAGALAVLGIVIGFARGQISPTINVTQPDPAIDLNVVTANASPVRLRHAVANGLGFGGQNAVVVLGTVG